MIITSEVPPLAKIEKIGYEKPFVRCLIPSFSFPRRMLSGIVRFVSAEKNAVIKDAIDAIEKKFAGNGRVLIRPSGTEPKLKAYISVTAPDLTAARALERRIAEEVRAKI